MRTTLFTLLVAVMAMLLSCNPVKTALKHGLVANDPMHIAMMDFVKTSKLYKKDSVFHITTYNTVWRLALKQYQDRNYKWVRDFKYDGITAVNILGRSDIKFLLTAKTAIGSKGKLPSRFIELYGKLFYWYDDDYPLTEELLVVFKKYNLLKDEGGMLISANNPTDDAKKGVHYYFCTKDFSNYKKVTTNIALGYYDAPDLSCKSY